MCSLERYIDCAVCKLSQPNLMYLTNVHKRVRRHHVQVPAPGVAVTYGKYMSSVDKSDAMMTKKLYAQLGHGSCEVWRHLLWYLVNMAISNAWILYKESSTRQQPKNFDHMAFRLELSEGLISGFAMRKKLISPKMNVYAKLLKICQITSSYALMVKGLNGVFLTTDTSQTTDLKKKLYMHVYNAINKCVRIALV